MGLWSWLFGTRQPQPVKRARPSVSRSSAAVRRLALRRGVSIWDLDLFDDSIIEDLLLLGLILSDDGSCYEDDLSFVGEDTSGSTVEDFTETSETVETAPVEVTEEVTKTVETTPVETEPVVETTPVVEATPVVEELPTPVPEVPAIPPSYDTPSVDSAPSWAGETSSSSWSSSGSSDFGGGGGGGGSDSGGGGGGDD